MRLLEFIDETSVSKLFENFQIAVIISSPLTDSEEPDAQIAYCNPFTRKLFGYQKNELVGMPISKLFNPHEPEKRSWVVKELSEKGFSIPYERSMQTSKGKDLWVWIQNLTLLPPHIITIIHDATHLKHIELALHQKTVAYRHLISELENEKKNLLSNIATHLEEVCFKVHEQLEPILTSDQLRLHDMCKNFWMSALDDSKPTHAKQILAKLSATEKKISRYLKKGLSYREIGLLHGVKRRTIDKHVQNIRRKLGISGVDITTQDYLKSLHAFAGDA